MIKYFRNRIWYRIELFIGKGGKSMFYALGIILLFTIFFLLGIRYLLIWILPETAMPAEDLGSNVYHLFMELTDPGTMGNFLNAPFWVKSTAIFAGLCGIIIFSLLVAIINSAVEKMLFTFSQGTTDVYEKGHFLIIGYNSRLTDILKEFVIASEFEKHTVVVFSELPKEEIEAEIELKIPNFNKLRIVTRRGETTSPRMLEKVSVDTAQSIIVLSSCESFSSETEKEVSDTEVIKICYALSLSINSDIATKVIPEVYGIGNRDIIKTILHDRILQIDSNAFLSRLLVQTSLFNGLVGVYEELFSFEGSEIYLVDNLASEMTFGEISLRLKDGIVIGYKCPEEGLVLNPPIKAIIKKHFRLVLIMTGNTKFSIKEKSIRIQEKLVLKSRDHEPSHASILIVGWNSETAYIISEYDKYISKTSTLKLLLTASTAPKEDVLMALKNSINANLEIVIIEALDEKYLWFINLSLFDLVVVLTTSVETIHTKAVDSANIKVLLMIRKLLKNTTKRPLIIAEVFDTSNLELFEKLGLSDFLLSNRLISIFITQLAKQPELIEIYERLLSTDGAEIYIKPISNYLEKTEGDYTFADLIYLGQQCNEIIIGYKKMIEYPTEFERNYKIYLNPSKDKLIHLTHKDSFVVISSENLVL